MKPGTMNILGILVLLVITATAAADEPNPAHYVGVKACGICHKKEDSGNQLAAWQAGPHAKAYETLGTAEAKAIAAKLGIDDPQQSGKCMKCHSTAYNFTESIATEKIKPEEGVSCESCHGPGRKYMMKSIMQDREKAIAAGLVHPPTQNCTRCHNEESPSFKGFDEKSYVERILHPNPKVKD